jgi:hypothetical protein
MFLCYSLIMACQNFWSSRTFHSVLSRMLDNQYFFTVECIEIITFIFIRTRTSIKYFPKFITVSHMIFLMYVNSHMYAAQHEAINAMMYSNLAMISYFIYKYEVPAIQKWNPMGSYTPCLNNPRCGYHLVMRGSEFSIGFSLILMLTPVHFQEYFNSEN